ITGFAPAATVFAASTPESGLQAALVASGILTSAASERGYMNGNGTSFSSGRIMGYGLGVEAMIGWSTPLGPGTVTPVLQYNGTLSKFDDWTETGGPLPARFSGVDDLENILRIGTEGRMAVG